ncbi:hypothetical protein CGI18_07215 [Vibrio parahaemolyticus]|uniref:tail fiber domain-containing protein n=1 Tax=Vibrio parahaemolyticus TaxID=670 RepID=UPI00111E328F|nr:tail fiber domain-containing protein [Vibrio parahaemolyticus]TOK48274.1 hypothetical protein CGI18_07215 [Vibrio parahaemolyticus]
MNILKWQRIAEGANTKEFINIGGGKGSSSSSGSGSNSGQNWLLEQFGDEIGGLVGGLFGNLGNMPEFKGPDYDKAMAGLGGIGSFYKDMMTTDSSQELGKVLTAQADMANSNLQGSLANVSQGANMAGGAGGSRQGIAEGLATAQANSDLNALQSQTAASFMEKDRASKLQGAQGLAGTLGAGFNLSQDQARTEYMQELQSSNPEFYQLLQMQSALGGMAGWGGSSNSSWSQSGKNKNSSFGFSLSDERLKTIVSKVGGLANGLPLYVFKYTPEAIEKYGESSDLQIGVMAQDVLKVLPQAVLEHPDGVYVVDYALVCLDAIKAGYLAKDSHSLNDKGDE